KLAGFWVAAVAEGGAGATGAGADGARGAAGGLEGAVGDCDGAVGDCEGVAADGDGCAGAGAGALGGAGVRVVIGWDPAAAGRTGSASADIAASANARSAGALMSHPS